MENENIICPRCDSFIGDIGDLNECPVCGASLKGEDNDEEESVSD